MIGASIFHTCRKRVVDWGWCSLNGRHNILSSPDKKYLSCDSLHILIRIPTSILILSLGACLITVFELLIVIMIVLEIDAMHVHTPSCHD